MTKKKEKFIRFKKVLCPALNVRSNPSTDSIITKVLVMGTIVECDKNFDNSVWDHIITDPNVEGYCMKQYLEPLDPDTKAAFGSSPILINTYNYTCDSNDAEDMKNDGKEKEE